MINFIYTIKIIKTGFTVHNRQGQYWQILKNENVSLFELEQIL